MPRKPIAVVVAMRVELAPLLARMKMQSQQVDGVELFELPEALVAVGGVGEERARHAAEVVIERVQPKLLVSAGMAGAISPQLKAGDVGRISEVVDVATGVRFSTRGGEWVLASSQNISDVAGKRVLLTKYGADVVDMEGAAVARVAKERGLEFAAVKAIFDDSAFPMPPMNRFIDGNGRFDTRQFLVYIALHPKWWATLGKMRKNSKIASANLCRELEHLIEGSSQWSVGSGQLATGSSWNCPTLAKIRLERGTRRLTTGNWLLISDMSSATQLGSSVDQQTIPATMQAAVYRGVNDVRMEAVPVPRIGPGEILVRVHTCGICGTDLKKIATGSHSAPRIFGHETTGVVAALGDDVAGYELGDRVMVFHHIPCGECFYCRHKVFAQCPTYKKVGATAGYEPSGGGFAEYVRVMEWIVGKGIIRIPGGVSFERASFIEPINTCMKGIATLRLTAGETALVIGQGPIGIILAVLARRCGARVITSDLFPQRHTIAQTFGLNENIDASTSETVRAIKELTEGRGADAVILAVAGNALIRTAMDATRPGGRVLLFAQTQHGEATIDPAAVCVDEKSLLGSYSASVDLQEESARFVFSGEMELERLISHHFPLAGSVEALHLAAHPKPDSMKVVIQPGSLWKDQ